MKGQTLNTKCPLSKNGYVKASVIIYQSSYHCAKSIIDKLNQNCSNFPLHSKDTVMCCTSSFYGCLYPFYEIFTVWISPTLILLISLQDL